MVKVIARDILDILRRFELADFSNVPRNIENIKTTNPGPTNTLVGFRFNKQQYCILFDETADDDFDYVNQQVNITTPNTTGQLLTNPRDPSTTAMPYQGKSCYLFAVTSEKRRLDIELASRYSETSRSTWQKHIKAGHVTVNGAVAISTKADVTAVDTIAINLPQAIDFSEHSLPIIYIDDNVIVINKPVGVLSHSKGALNDEFTVADFFGRYSAYNHATNRPGIVHRLDRDTSGIMIGARNDEAATMLQKQFADRKTKKTYYAVTDGIPKLETANIDLPIGRNPSAPSTFRVDASGKSAITRYEVVAINGSHALVKLQPKTGRTHQLRVHMSYINAPIMGDRVYGKAGDRLYLHATSLEITIPGSERKIFEASLPAEFTNLFPDAKL